MASTLIWAARDAACLAAAAATCAARLAGNTVSSPGAAAAASRAARSASRAARSAAAAASRAGRSGSCVTCIPRSRANRDDAPHRPGTPIVALSGTVKDGYPVPGWDVTADDIASDEAIWALYENWCKYYNKERDRDEMIRRFPIFKNSAMEAYESEHLGENHLGGRADGLEKGIEEERAQLAACAHALGEKEYYYRKTIIDMWETEYKELGVMMD